MVGRVDGGAGGWWGWYLEEEEEEEQHESWGGAGTAVWVCSDPNMGPLGELPQRRLAAAAATIVG